jgi:hypothetical protein
MENKVFVSIYYSSDSDSPLYQFDSEKEAIDFIKRSYEEEIRISKEEGNDNVSYSYFNEDNGNAQICYDNDEGDFIEWSISTLRN